MKTKFSLLLVVAFAFTLAFSACGSQEKKSAVTEQVAEKQVYQCPMNCEGDKTYDNPGKCPVCGMDLEEVKEEGNSK
jgi:hypothetical protein